MTEIDPNTGSQQVQDKWIQRLGLALVASILIGLLPYEKHPLLALEQLPGFYGLFALVASIGLVMAASWLRDFFRDQEEVTRVD